MKKFAIFVLVLLLLRRIKTTPQKLSEEIWVESIRKKKQKLKERQLQRPMTETEKKISVILTLILKMFLIVFYIMLGFHIGETVLIVMSFLQVVICIVDTILDIRYIKHMLGNTVEDMLEEVVYEKNFHRVLFLINVVLDYAYYLFAIYLLLLMTMNDGILTGFLGYEKPY